MMTSHIRVKTTYGTSTGKTRQELVVALAPCSFCIRSYCFVLNVLGLVNAEPQTRYGLVLVLSQVRMCVLVEKRKLVVVSTTSSPAVS